MKTYNGIERIRAALSHDERRHTLKRRAYRTIEAYQRARRQDGKK